jgi:hypothetical protein
MNKKLIIILAVLVVIFLLTKLNNKSEKNINFFGADSADVYKIEISSEEESITISKESGEWMITAPVDYKPQTRKIEEIFSKVLVAETSDIPVSESESSFETYGVTDSLGTSVKIYDKTGKVLSDVIIGTSSNYNYSSARNVGRNKIYQLKENISYSLKPTLKNWRDRDVLALEETDIAKVQVMSKDINYTVAISDTAWVYTDGTNTMYLQTDSKPMKDIYSLFKKLTASDFIDDNYAEYEQSFENPEMMVIIDRFNADPITLTYIAKDDTKYILKRNEETGTLFEAYQSMSKRLLKTYEDFQK